MISEIIAIPKFQKETLQCGVGTFLVLYSKEEVEASKGPGGPKPAQPAPADNPNPAPIP